MTIDELQERFNELRAKKWQTSDYRKEPVELIGFTLADPRYPLHISFGGKTRALTFDLMLTNSDKAPFIEEVSPYTDWPIDAKILVWDTGSEKMKRHFAGIADNGKPKAFLNGYSSWSAPLQTNEWDYAELAED